MSIKKKNFKKSSTGDVMIYEKEKKKIKRASE